MAIHYDSSERIKNYKSKFYMELVEEEKEQKEQQRKMFMEKKKLVEKASSYAKYVREMYAPVAVEAKENLLQNDLED
jgi:protein subunit release factor B